MIFDYDFVLSSTGIEFYKEELDPEKEIEYSCFRSNCGNWRVVTKLLSDATETNIYFKDWRTRFITIKASCLPKDTLCDFINQVNTK